MEILKLHAVNASGMADNTYSIFEFLSLLLNVLDMNVPILMNCWAKSYTSGILQYQRVVVLPAMEQWFLKTPK